MNLHVRHSSFSWQLHHARCLLVSLLTCLIVTGNLCGQELTGYDAMNLMKRGEIKRAMQIFESLASRGDTRSMVQLGLFYHQGEGVNQDYAAAMDWYLKAYKKNNADAFVNIGVMYRDGLGVPKNKKIAYCIFLTTHMCGLGGESTVMRANSCLRRLGAELLKDDIKDCLSNFTLKYVDAYISSVGNLTGIPDQFKPSSTNLALRDLDWWVDGELDPIFGKPSKDELEQRRLKRESLQKENEDLLHTLFFQIHCRGNSLSKFLNCNTVTESSMGSTPFSRMQVHSSGDMFVLEGSMLIRADQRRFITLENDRHEFWIFEIKHPVKPLASDWSQWFKPDSFSDCRGLNWEIMHTGLSQIKSLTMPDNVPEFRFCVLKGLQNDWSKNTDQDKKSNAMDKQTEKETSPNVKNTIIKTIDE